MQERETFSDVIVLGAGLAGLSAARELSKNLRVIVLDARDEVGGRVRSVGSPAYSVPMELGPEFVHGHVDAVFDLLPAAGLIAYDIPDRHVDPHNADASEEDPAWEEAYRFLESLDRVGQQEMSFAEFLRRFGDDLSEPARARAVAFVEGFNAADQAKISVQALIEAARAEQANDGQRQYRLIGAYQHLPQMLADSIRGGSRVELGCRVDRVNWREGAVEVSAGGRLFAAPVAVVALPLGVLQAGRVTFTPDLPHRVAISSAVTMGPVVKVQARFREAFWESRGRTDLNFIHDLDQPFPTWWTTLPLRTTHLTGWCGGSAADRLPADDASLRDAAVRSLATIFQTSESDITDQIDQMIITDWRTEEHALGAYSYVNVGQLELARTLADPIRNTLFLAGEYTDVGLIGTVAGAIASGRRAAEQVRRAIRNDAVR